MTTAESSSRPQRWRRIFLLAWPLIVANSFWNIQLTIDRVFLGQYSTTALAAAMAVAGLFWVPMALLQQTAAYLMTFVAQFDGAKEHHRIGPSLWQSIYLSLIGGSLLLLLIPVAPWIFAHIGHEAALQKMEVEYFQALITSAMPTALVAAASAFFTGLGQTRVIIGINVIGLIGNAFFDYVLIFGNWGFPAWGAAGAGYATALGTWLSALYGLILVFRQHHETLYRVRSGFRLDWDLSRRFLKFGLPAGAQWALEGMAFTVFLIFVGRMDNGAAALAASAIVTTLMMLAVLPPMGVAQAVAVLVGQHIGEKQPQRAIGDVWAGLQISLMYIAVVALSFVLVPEFYLGWFQNDENPALWTEVLRVAPVLLLFVALFTGFDSMNVIFSFALKGAGDTRFVTAIALMMPWPFMVFPTWWVMHWPNAIYWAWGAASGYIILQALVFWRRFEGGRWKSMSVIHG